MSDDDAARAAPDGFADRLWARTGPLHREAERSGIVRDLLRGNAGRDGYALLLRNLLPVYEALERGLDGLRGADGSRGSVALGGLAQPAVYRAPALRADLATLGGAGLPLLPSGRAYADRVEAAARDGGRLIGHAYVRYLGDLNGGQILRRLIGRHLGLGGDGLDAGGLAFYDFPADPAALAGRYRSEIDAAGAALSDPEAVIEEACTAFRLSIALSNEVARRAGDRDGAPET